MHELASLPALMNSSKRKNPTSFGGNCTSLEIASLSSLLYSFINGNRSAFQTNLSMIIHGLTRSRKILDLMKRFALGISYQDVLDLYAVWALCEFRPNIYDQMRVW